MGVDELRASLESKGLFRVALPLWLLTTARGWMLPEAEQQQLLEKLPLQLNLPPNYQPKDGEEFEYIVVGAGAAGSAAAARLALAGRSVLLVEAGGDPDLLSTVPAGAMALLGSPLDWQYETLPNNVSCLSSEGRQCRFARGKCLGGSTSINYMMYVRGNRRDYDYGLEGWTWDDLKPYFLRYEGLQDLDLLPASSRPYHNTSGIMKIGFFADPKNEWASRIMEGWKSFEIPVNRDMNAESQIGVSHIVGYVYEGQRMSSARAYLTNDNVKKNLKVAKHTRCVGVEIDSAGAARGVRVVGAGGARRLAAARAVVLAAGALGSPQILQLSGVGPAQHLQSLGIPVRADLPVGEDMSDHVLPLMFVAVDNNILNLGLNLVGTVPDVAQYLLSRDGPLASNGLTDTTVLLNTKCYDAAQQKLLNNSIDCELPSMQIIHAYIERGLLPVGLPIAQHSLNFNSEIMKQLAEINVKYGLLVISPIVLQPESRGWVRLRSADPLAPPDIFPNYLAAEADMQEVLRGIAVVERLVETAAFRAGGASLVRLRLPDCPSGAGYWACYARHLTFSVFHAAGTSALGRVLDARLRVRGVRRLRVADLGAAPAVPRGNTAALAIAIGERVADFLLEDKDDDEDVETESTTTNSHF